MSRLATDTTDSIPISGLLAPTGDVSWASHKITNLANPTAAQDAATKSYTDSAAAAGSTYATAWRVSMYTG